MSAHIIAWEQLLSAFHVKRWDLMPKIHSSLSAAISPIKQLKDRNTCSRGGLGAMLACACCDMEHATEVAWLFHSIMAMDSLARY